MVSNPGQDQTAEKAAKQPLISSLTQFRMVWSAVCWCQARRNDAEWPYSRIGAEIKSLLNRHEFRQLIIHKEDKRTGGRNGGAT
jgi:hypothetical protein